MDFNEHTYDKIQRYLDDALSPAERQAFEQEMIAQPELAAEIALHREMADFLADSEENELRKNLHRVVQETNEPPSAAGGKWRFLWLLLPVFLAVGWWFLSFEEEKPPSSEANVTIEKQDFILEEAAKSEAENKEKILPQDTVQSPENVPTKIGESSKDTIIYANEKLPKIEPLKPPSDTPKEREPPPLLAANFEPNPQLEFLRENNLRGDDLEILVEAFTEKFEAKSVDFVFAGQLKAAENLLNKNYQVHLFSNAVEDYQNFTPLNTFSLDLEEKSAGTFVFSMKKELKFLSGLYYLLLENAETEQVLWVDAFRVFDSD